MYEVQIRFDGELLTLPRRFRTLHSADRAVADFLDTYGIPRDRQPFRIAILDSKRSNDLQPNPTDPTDALTVS